MDILGNLPDVLVGNQSCENARICLPGEADWRLGVLEARSVVVDCLCDISFAGVDVFAIQLVIDISSCVGAFSVFVPLGLEVGDLSWASRQ